MRIRLTLEVTRHRDTPPQIVAEQMPDVWEASGTTTERAGRQPIGFAIPAPGEDDTWEDRT